MKQTRNQKDGLPAQDGHRSVKESADAVDSSRRPPDPQRALREPVSVCAERRAGHAASVPELTRRTRRGGLPELFRRLGCGRGAGAAVG